MVFWFELITSEKDFAEGARRLLSFFPVKQAGNYEWGFRVLYFRVPAFAARTIVRNNQ